MASKDVAEISQRETNVLERHPRLKAALAYFDNRALEPRVVQYISELKTPNSSTGQEQFADLWVSFMEAFESVVWNLRVIFDVNLNPRVGRTEPLTNYEIAAKRVSKAAMENSVFFEHLLKLLSEDYDIWSLPGNVAVRSNYWPEGAVGETLELPLKSLQPEESPPAELLNLLSGNTYPQCWRDSPMNNESDEPSSSEQQGFGSRRLLADMRRFAFACAVVAKREKHSGMGLRDFAQTHIDEFFDDPVALFFIALAFSSDTTASRQQRLLGQQYARAVIHKFPDQHGAFNILARSISENITNIEPSLQQSALEEAHSLVNRALELDPTFYKYYLVRSRIRLELQTYGAAEDDVLLAEDLAGSEASKVGERAEEMRSDINNRRKASADVRQLRDEIETKLTSFEHRASFQDRRMDERDGHYRETEKEVSQASAQMDRASQVVSGLEDRISSMRRELLAVTSIFATVLVGVFGSIDFVRNAIEKDVANWSEVLLSILGFIFLLCLVWIVFFWALSRFNGEQKQKIPRPDH